jgi:hypothetical protein
MPFLVHALMRAYLFAADYFAVMRQFWSHPHFLHPWMALLLLLTPFVVWNWARRQITFRHPNLSTQEELSQRRGAVLIVAACAFLAATYACVVGATMFPVVPDKTVQHLVQTRNVCQFVDRSGSMQTVLKDGAKELSDLEGSTNNDPSAVKTKNQGNDQMLIQSPDAAAKADHPMTRIEAAQLAARIFIHTLMTYDPNETNHFCIFSFDDDSYMMMPLTNDKTVAELRTVHITENTGGGTNFGGPCGFSSGIGPLEKAYDYFTKYTGPESIRVDFMVTDGYDSIDPACAKRLHDKFLEAHIKLYVVGLGEGWSVGNNLDLQKFADDLHKADPTSGFVFLASNPGAMWAAINKVNEMEKAQELIETVQLDREIIAYFIATSIIAGTLFFAFVALMRKNP